MPPTTDRGQVNRAIDALTLQDSTAIGDAINVAMATLQSAPKAADGSIPPGAIVLLIENKLRMNQIKIIIEHHPDGYIAYPVGLNGVVIGEGDTYREALDDITTAIKFHIETFGTAAFQDYDLIRAA